MPNKAELLNTKQYTAK